MTSRALALAACHHSFHEGFCEGFGFVEDDDEASEGSDSSIGIKVRGGRVQAELDPDRISYSKCTMDEDEIPYVWFY